MTATGDFARVVVGGVPTGRAEGQPGSIGRVARRAPDGDVDVPGGAEAGPAAFGGVVVGGDEGGRQEAPEGEAEDRRSAPGGESPVAAGGTKAEQSADRGAADAKEHGTEADPAEGLADALCHLQAAALSMVAAARAAVDVAEHLVRDPKPLLDLIAEAARAGWEPPGGSPTGRSPSRSGVEHIAVRRPDEGGVDRSEG